MTKHLICDLECTNFLTPRRGCLHCFLGLLNSYLLIKTQLFLNSLYGVTTSSSVLRTDLHLVLIHHTYYNKHKWDSSHEALRVVAGTQYTSIRKLLFWSCKYVLVGLQPQSPANALGYKLHWTFWCIPRAQHIREQMNALASYSVLFLLHQTTDPQEQRVWEGAWRLGRALTSALQKITFRCTSNLGSCSTLVLYLRLQSLISIHCWKTVRRLNRNSFQ